MLSLTTMVPCVCGQNGASDDPAYEPPFNLSTSIQQLTQAPTGNKLEEIGGELKSETSKGALKKSQDNTQRDPDMRVQCTVTGVNCTL